MVSSKFVLGLAAATVAFAAPLEERNAACMSAAQAQQVATNFGQLISNYSDSLANQVLTKNYHDYSESVNSLIDECPQGSAAVALPLLDPTFSSRAAFEKGQAQQPSINFNQLEIWHTCNTVTFRWETTNTAPIANPRPVVGIIVAETVRSLSGSAYPWIIKTLYSEFDAGAWLANLVDAGICPAYTASTASSTVSTTATASSTPSGTATATTTATDSATTATDSTATATSTDSTATATDSTTTATATS